MPAIAKNVLTTSSSILEHNWVEMDMVIMPCFSLRILLNTLLSLFK